VRMTVLIARARITTSPDRAHGIGLAFARREQPKGRPHHHDVEQHGVFFWARRPGA